MSNHATLLQREDQKTSYFLSNDIRSLKRRRLVESNEHENDAKVESDEQEDGEKSESKTREDEKTTLGEIENEGHDNPDENNPFARLLGGKEPLSSVDLRWNMYLEAWAVQKAKIDELLEMTNGNVLEDIVKYVSESDSENQIPVALVFPGSNIANHVRLFGQIREWLGAVKGIHMVTLHARTCPTLKAIIKNIVGDLIESEEVAEAVEVREEDLNYDRRVKYDFSILAEWCRKVGADASQRVVLILEDVDSFDVKVLSNLVLMMHSYKDEIPFRLVFGIATSLEIFEHKMTKTSIRNLQGQVFDAQATSTFQSLFENHMFNLNNKSIIVGPTILEDILKRQNVSTESIDAFISSLKYAYMSHYYSNPFAVFTSRLLDAGDEYEEIIDNSLTGEHIDALRMLQSFRALTESKTDPSEIDSLLSDDSYIMDLTKQAVHDFKVTARRVVSLLNLFETAEEVFGKFSVSWGKMAIYIPLVRGELEDTDFFRAVCESFKAQSEEKMQLLVDELAKDDLFDWLHDSNSLLDTITTAIQNLKPFKQHLYHEIFVTDLATLQQNVFVPFQRPAIETALADPRHYLGIEDDGNKFTFVDPNISTMFTLYRESGIYINIYDWYVAFKECMPRSVIEAELKKQGLVPEEGETDDEWDKRTLSWFYQAAAELKFIGCVRDTKRKVESVEKLIWRGL
ncbi:Origin recognition complex subunit 3 [Yarrowia sp. C11]|nr:Origin recognition complex subunit 3 [Yarrowia sp. C11]KAG5364469.1 Origin recognition complex subunit 3 [Yarrowia sp. E02]